MLFGSLTGAVSDKSGAVLTEISVTATNQGTGVARTEKTNARGVFDFRDLAPGVYALSVPKTTSFAGYSVKDITIDANHERRVDIELQLAGVTAVVTVNSAAAEMQTETAEVNSELSETELSSLPITSGQGRNFQSLYTIIPGAAAVTEQNSTASNPSRAMSANVNGTEDMGVTMRIDGAINTYGWLPYIVAYVPPADSIESVNVVTNSFNAEQGLAGGAAINVTIKTGTRQLHGSGWEYYQDGGINARGYTATQASLVSPSNPTGSIPKNVFNQYGFSVGGPVYIPKILTGRKKLFFFEAFERTTRRQLITGVQTVPDVAMIGGDFTEVANLGLGAKGFNQSTILYDPQPLTPPAGCPTSGYQAPGCRVPFMNEYANAAGTQGTGFNGIPVTRQSKAGSTMLALLKPIATLVGTPTANQLDTQMANDYNGHGTFDYNRMTSDSKVTYSPSENTNIFGRYSAEPFKNIDPQELGAAGGGTFDGGQPGLGHGRIQNIGLGFSHVYSANLVLDGDFGYTRQITGAQSSLDIADGNFGLDTLGIPGTNGPTSDYAGQPAFAFSSTFSSIGNPTGGSPFLFRENQFTGDVNLSWTKGKHATKYGATWYHFDLNHFQPTSGAGINIARGGFNFQGGLTTGPTDVDQNGNANNTTGYNAIADLLLGLPNNGTSAAVAHPSQVSDPNSLRWSDYATYAQDQWSLSNKLTLNYGVRYEFYPAPYRDHSGIAILDPNLPQTANVELGGVNGNPENAGLNMGHGQFTPRLGLAYRLNQKTVIRAGGGLTTDPDSLRFMRDSFPEDLAPSYSGASSDSIAIDTANGNAPMPLNSYGIPIASAPAINSAGFVSLPVSGGTNTVRKDYHRGYVESWNLFVERDLGHNIVANVGYVGTHQVRQLSGVSLNAAPLPTAATPCMPNGQYSATSGLTGPCSSYQVNTIINQQHCAGNSNLACYNTGGITMNEPIFSSNYNGMQSQLTRNAGKNTSFGLVYTWSHAFDYEDNGAGSGGAGTAISYPAYFKLQRASAGYNRKHNVQLWAIYHLPFGHDQLLASHGVAAAVLGGFQLNGQFSHISGAPFSVSPSSSVNLNSPGNTLYAQLVAPYHQLGGHERKPIAGTTAGAWFDPASFNNPAEPSSCAVYNAKSCPNPNTTNASPFFSNTHRNEFTGPGFSNVNASIFRSIQIHDKDEFQFRMEVFNVFNHTQLTSNPNVTVGGSTFGYITSFGNTRSMQFSGRIVF